jgi:hypothetical protein
MLELINEVGFPTFVLAVVITLTIIMMRGK